MKDLLKKLTSFSSKPMNCIREDGFKFFNSEILKFALDNSIPLLERINYLHIVLDNYIEQYSRLSKIYYSTQYYEIFNELIDIAGDLNAVFSKINFNETLHFSKEIPSLHLEKTSEDDQAILIMDGNPSIQYVSKSDAEGLEFDGIHYVPLTYVKDCSLVYDIPEPGLWAEEYLKECNKIADARYAPQILVWVNANTNIKTKSIIGDMLEPLGFYPIFINVDLLNCINYKSSPDEVNLNYEPIEHKYYNNDYLNKTNFCDVFRMPFDSFDNVIDLYDQAIHNDMVDAIYITIYRTKMNRKLINTLIQGTHLGKTLNIYVELTARGDEKQNYALIRKLKDECDPKHLNLYTSYGCYKIHAKLGLIAMKNGKFICHCGTGNFNEVTANFYKDTHIITDDAVIVNDALQSFNDIATKRHKECNKLKTILRTEIYNEIEKGINGRIILKCNHFVDRDIDNLLKIAKDSGCEVKILPRSTFGYSEDKFGKKKFRGGRFLEHERVYIFGYGLNTRVYLSSSDIMFRNLYKRREFTFKLPAFVDTAQFINECYV